MATAGPNWCGTGASYNDGGTTTWSNPTNVQGDTTGTAATCAIGSNGGTSWKLRCSNFGFSIDASATILGILVEIERMASSNNRAYENNIQLLIGGTESGDNKSTGAVIPNVKGFASYGASDNLWGLTPTVAQVNASGFGFSYKALRNASQAVTVSAYRVRITVTYSVPVEYTDSATSSMLMSPSSTEFQTHEYTDTQTATVLVSPSSQDIREIPDAATASVALAPSGTEEREVADSDIASVLLQPSGTDEQASGGPKQTGTDRIGLFDGSLPTDRTGHYLRAIASIANAAHDGVIRFQIYDSSTAIGPQFETTALTDSPVEYVFPVDEADASDITSYENLEVSFYGYSANGDSTEFRIHELWLETPPAAPAEKTDSGTVTVKLSVSSTDIREIPEASEVYALLQASGVDVAEFADGQTILADIVASGTEFPAHDYTDTQTTSILLSPTSADVAEFVESAESILNLEVSTADVAIFIDSANVLTDIEASGTDEHVPYGGTEYPDSATVLIDLESTGTDIREIPDEAVTRISVTPSGVDIAQLADAAEAPVDLIASGTEVQIFEYVDSATVTNELDASGTDIYIPYGGTEITDEAIASFNLDSSGTELREITDAAQALVDIQTSASDVAVSVDSSVAPITLSPSSVDIGALQEADSIVLDMQSSGTDELSSTDIDAGQVQVGMQTSSGDVLGTIESASILFDLVPDTYDVPVWGDIQLVELEVGIASLDEREMFESAEVYLDLTARSIFVKVDFLLEIVGVAMRWTIQMPLKRWLIFASRRWTTEDSYKRWTVLVTRRFRWKSS